MDTNQANTQESFSCQKCGIVLDWIRIPSILGLPEKWIAPRNCVCDLCDKALRDEIKKNEEIRLAEERTRRAAQLFASSVADSMLPPRFQDKIFDNFKVSEQNKAAYDAARSFEIDEEGTGLLLCGGCGIGKSHLAASIANKFLGKVSLLYISCPDLLSEIRGSIRTDAASKKLDMAKGIDLLILDDIGAENATEWARETLFILINYRVDQKLPTIFTTNCKADELSKKLGDRIASRIIGSCHCIKYEAQDFRIRNRPNLNLLRGGMEAVGK